jgi:hypothetical protein
MASTADRGPANRTPQIDWRKGTGLATSPADKGRDIVCDHFRVDPTAANISSDGLSGLVQAERNFLTSSRM